MAKHIAISITKVDDISGDTFGRTLAQESLTDLHTLWTAHQYLDAVSSLWSGLAGYWKMEESNATRVDSFYNHPMSEVGGNTGNVAGKVGMAADFIRANNRRLESPPDDDVIGTGDVDYTFACWINFTSKTVGGGSGNNHQNIILKHNLSDSLVEHRFYYDGPSDRVKFEVTGATATADNLGSPAISTWYFVILEHIAATNTISIEVNRGTPNTAGSAAPVRRTGPLIFGGDIFGGGSLLKAFDGLLDEVGFWRRILTTTEKDELYNTGTGITIPLTVFKENRKVQYAKSIDTGAIWTDGAGGGSGSTFDVSNPVAPALRPATALDSVGWLHAVWEDRTSGQLYYRSRTNVGVWGTIDTTSLVAVGKVIMRPHIIATANDSLHVVAWNTTDNAVYWAYSVDNGTTWTVAHSQFTGGAASYRQMGFDADSLNNLHLAFIKSTNKAAYSKAVFAGPSTWTWGAEDTTSINDGTVSSQGDCSLVVAPDDDVFAGWEAIFSSPNGVRLRWAKRPGAVGAWSSQANAAFTSTTTSGFRRPIMGYDSLGAVYLAHSVFTSSLVGKNSRITFHDDDTGIEAFTNADSTSIVGDAFGEETVRRTLSPHSARRGFGSIIPATFIDLVNSTYRFTTFHPITGIARKNIAAESLSISERQDSLIRTSATTFHAMFNSVTAPRFRYMKSTDGGATWTDGEGGASNSFFTIQSTTLTFIEVPSMAIDSLGNIYTVWTERSAFSGNTTVFFRRRVGGVWQAVDSISLTLSKQIRLPSILVDASGNIHVIAYNKSDFFFYHAYSLDQGATWTVNGSASAYGNLSNDNNTISFDRDTDNNLILITMQFDPIDSNVVPGFRKATFTSPSTWTWGASDDTTFENPDITFDLEEEPWVRADYTSSSNRFDAVWKEVGPGGGSAPSILRHGIKTNATSSKTTIHTTIDDDGVNVVYLAKDDSVHLHALLRYPDDFSGIIYTVATFNRTTQVWSNISPLARTLNVVGASTVMIERQPIHPTPTTGDVYVMSTGGISSSDDRRTAWLEAAVALPAAPPPPVITTQTILANNEIVREFVIKDIRARI
jgi:hypothetical protein